MNERKSHPLLTHPIGRPVWVNVYRLGSGPPHRRRENAVAAAWGRPALRRPLYRIKITPKVTSAKSAPAARSMASSTTALLARRADHG